ncbi:hypothetical protein IPA_07970 [Ignicoccus pacificus DSM 13166]|uniref:DUF447 domain-containing protein n=1 Tax=Ignicoccus pacificus DSM 13166 TaxID=940294 RepID=A0A977PKE1_9CREN|nr:hypothetical protein IPA_07970 [Ignicoccus pacificus DSM 13166]
MIAVTEGRTSALGVVPKGNFLIFKLYPGRFAKALMESGKLTLYASSSSLDYVESALTKDLDLIETPIGPGPPSWYLAIECEVVSLSGEGPWEGRCKPKKAFSRPSSPPSRSFFFVLEAAIHATRIFLSEEHLLEAKRYLELAEKYGEEEDLKAVSKIREYLAKYNPKPEVSQDQG